MPRTTLNGSLNGDSRLSYTGSRLWYALNVLEQMRADRLDCPVLPFVPKRIAYPTEHTTAICSPSRVWSDLFWISLEDRKSVVEGKSVAVRGDLGGRRIITKKHK